MAERYGTLNLAAIDKLVSDKDAQSTKDAVKQAVNNLRTFLSIAKKNVKFEDLSPEELCQELVIFWANTRKVGGDYYKIKSFEKIKFGIKKFLIDEVNFNIDTHPALKKSKDVFKASCVQLKRVGKGSITHKTYIEPEDMEKLFNDEVVFNIDTPTGLRNKVWFSIVFNFARRGQQNLTMMKRNHYDVKNDAQGIEFVMQAVDELDKNHRADDNEPSSGKMYSIQGACFTFYF